MKQLQSNLHSAPRKDKLTDLEEHVSELKVENKRIVEELRRYVVETKNEIDNNFYFAVYCSIELKYQDSQSQLKQLPTTHDMES